jgi:hypothetical protein
MYSVLVISKFEWSVTLISCLSWILYVCTRRVCGTFWIVVLSTPCSKLQQAIHSFRLLKHHCLMCSTTSSNVHDLPVEFCFLALPISLNWVDYWLINVSRCLCSICT